MDLNKIAPKEKFSKNKEDEGRLEFINKNGKTYFVPYGEKEQPRINGIRSWERAFRVYAAIYTSANPHRGAEIYQYVHSINLAALSFQWDNVAYYDYNFRHMMGLNPQHSWAKVNTQLWSLAMRDPKPTEKGGRNSLGNNNKGSDNKESYCWKFNKNQCTKNAATCRFVHKCSYCGGNNHAFVNCLKRNKNKDNSKEDDKKNSQHKRQN